MCFSEKKSDSKELTWVYVSGRMSNMKGGEFFRFNRWFWQDLTTSSINLKVLVTIRLSCDIYFSKGYTGKTYMWWKGQWRRGGSKGIICVNISHLEHGQLLKRLFCATALLDRSLQTMRGWLWLLFVENRAPFSIKRLCNILLWFIRRFY